VSGIDVDFNQNLLVATIGNEQISFYEYKPMTIGVTVLTSIDFLYWYVLYYRITTF
jgi:hypothetical protein